MRSQAGEPLLSVKDAKRWSEAVFKFLPLSLVAEGYGTAHLTLLSNFLGEKSKR